MPVISAPDIVVGIAATRAPVTEATALATSIGRPPPSATSDCRPRPSPSSAAARSGTWPGATSCTAAAAAASSGGAGQRPRGAQQLEGREVVLAQQLRGLRDPVVAEDDRAAGVPPDEVPVHSPESVRGFLTGLRLGSTSARMCS